MPENYVASPYAKQGIYNVDIVVSETKEEKIMETWRLNVKGMAHNWIMCIDRRIINKTIPKTDTKTDAKKSKISTDLDDLLR